MARQLGFLLASLVLLSCFAEPSYGNPLFSSLKKSLIVTASPTHGQGTYLILSQNNLSSNYLVNLAHHLASDYYYFFYYYLKLLIVVITTIICSLESR